VTNINNRKRTPVPNRQDKQRRRQKVMVWVALAAVIGGTVASAVQGLT
jgi:hypothetical protein